MSVRLEIGGDWKWRRRMPIRAKSAAALLLLALNAGRLHAAQSRDRDSLEPSIDSLFAVRELKEVAVSPDGRRVAWVESLHEKNAGPSPNSSISVSGLDSARTPPPAHHRWVRRRLRRA